MLSPLTGTMLPLGASRAPGGLPAYVRQLIDVYGVTAIWRLTDIASGTTVPETLNAARDGVQQGWTLQNVATPVLSDPGLAPLSHGTTTDKGNLFTASLASVFNPTAGTLLMIVDYDGVFTATPLEQYLQLTGSNGEFFRLSKLNASNQSRFTATFANAATFNAMNVLPPTSGFYQIGIAWTNSTIAKLPLNGVYAIAQALTAGSNWVGTLTAFSVGAAIVSTNQSLRAWMSYVLYFDRMLSDADLLGVYNDISMT